MVPESEIPKVWMYGVLDPSRVILFGGLKLEDRRHVPDKFYLYADPIEVIDEKDEDELKPVGLYTKVDKVTIEVNYSDPALTTKIGNTYVGFEYLKKAIDYIKVVSNLRSSFNTILRNNIVDFYVGEGPDMPLMVVYREYAAVIAPRVVDL